MVALSILFSYGLQFCVPSEIVWVRLEPWLQKRKQNKKYSADGKFTTSCTPTVTTIAGSTMSTATAVTTTSAASVDEKKQLEIESNQQDIPITGEYYVMRATMILGTGKTLLLSLIYYRHFAISTRVCSDDLTIIMKYESNDDYSNE